MKVKIIVYDFKIEGDTLEQRMVRARIRDLVAEFEFNHVATEVDYR